MTVIFQLCLLVCLMHQGADIKGHLIWNASVILQSSSIWRHGKKAWTIKKTQVSKKENKSSNHWLNLPPAFMFNWQSERLSIHPSIVQSCGGTGVYPGCHGAIGRVHTEADNHSCTHLALNLEMSVNLNHACLWTVTLSHRKWHELNWLLGCVKGLKSVLSYQLFSACNIQFFFRVQYVPTPRYSAFLLIVWMYFTPSHKVHHGTHESSLAGACVAFCLTQWGNLFCAAQATEKNGFQSAAHGPSYVKEHHRKPECSDRTQAWGEHANSAQKAGQ